MDYFSTSVALVHWLQNAKEILQDLQNDHYHPLFISDVSVTSNILEFVWETINDPVINNSDQHFMSPYFYLILFSFLQKFD